MTEHEVASWDGSLLTLYADLLLAQPTGAVMLSITLTAGTPPVVEPPIHQVMARLPTADELLELVRTAAAGWSRTNRRSLTVRARFMDELEARSAWGDR